jgi:hypothetical protein
MFFMPLNLTTNELVLEIIDINFLLRKQRDILTLLFIERLGTTTNCLLSS